MGGQKHIIGDNTVGTIFINRILDVLNPFEHKTSNTTMPVTLTGTADELKSAGALKVRSFRVLLAWSPLSKS